MVTSQAVTVNLASVTIGSLDLHQMGGGADGGL